MRPTGWFSIEVAVDTSGEASRGDSTPKVAGLLFGAARFQAKRNEIPRWISEGHPIPGVVHQQSVPWFAAEPLSWQRAPAERKAL